MVDVRVRGPVVARAGEVGPPEAPGPVGAQDRPAPPADARRPVQRGAAADRSPLPARRPVG